MSYVRGVLFSQDECILYLRQMTLTGTVIFLIIEKGTKSRNQKYQTIVEQQGRV